MNPREGHAALLAELRRRLEVCEAQEPGPWTWDSVDIHHSDDGVAYHHIFSAVTGNGVADTYHHGTIVVPQGPLAGSIAARPGRTENANGIMAQRNERPAELRAQIQIAELHAPVNLDREPSHAHLTMCSVCYTENKNWPCRTIAPLLAACGIEVTR